MPTPFDRCAAALTSALASGSISQADRNEATTRIQLVDKLLFEWLDWDANDVVLEDAHGKEYADYLFNQHKRVMIVEAKREGRTFTLPLAGSGLDFQLSSIIRGNTDLLAAIEQVQGYCSKRSVPFGVVCNGHQLVVFAAVRTDGVPYLEGRCVCFRSLEHIRDNFTEFWNCLSTEAVCDGHLSSRLLGRPLDQIPPKLSQSIPDYPGVKQRNPFQAQMQIMSELVLEDLPKVTDIEESFLRECYCSSGALSQYAMLSKQILDNRYSELTTEKLGGPTVVPAATRSGINKEMLYESMVKRPILLLGDVGVGKSMFVRSLMLVEAKEYFNRSIGIYIDCGARAILDTNIQAFVLEEIVRQLRDTYSVSVDSKTTIRGVLNVDLDNFAKGLYGDLQQSDPVGYANKEREYLEGIVKNRRPYYLGRVMNHLRKGQKREVIIFLDNCDQRNASFQQDAFLVAQEIASDWNVLTFVAIRPETYYASKRSGTLSAYHAKAFTVAPPRVDHMLERRLAFADKLASGTIQSQAMQSSQADQLKDLQSVIRVFAESLIDTPDLIQCIDNVSAGNMRKALDMVRHFLGSGHVDTQKISRLSPGYRVPLHEFLRALIFGDCVDYDPSQSSVVNVFDIRVADGKYHFLVPCLIGCIATTRSAEVNSGFVPSRLVIEHMQSLGFLADRSEEGVRLCVKRGLVESIKRRAEDLAQGLPDMLRPTSLGIYHTATLAGAFTYLDAMAVDTPVLDRSFANKIQNVSLISDRLDRAEFLVGYLNQQWHALAATEAHRIFDWPDRAASATNQISRIRETRKRPSTGFEWRGE